MWRTKDFDEVTFYLRRLRGVVPSGNIFETDELGRTKQIARAADNKTKPMQCWPLIQEQF